ncbi:hypothetical protein F4801DRAFT_582869 [Xylaria longipes]|nr:hypothetical protein F4801DRAFT_582869 [Xylaria longipes]
MTFQTANVALPIKPSDSPELNKVETQLQGLLQEMLSAGSVTRIYSRLIKGRFEATVPIVQLLQASSLGQMVALLRDPQQMVQGIMKGERVPERRAGRKGLGYGHRPDGRYGLPSQGDIRKESERRLSPSPKIAVHNGNPVAPRLGLLATEARAVFNEADVIIHAGADVSFLKAYNSLRATNWVNEVSLKRVTRELALDVVIHRPTSIVPEDDVETAEAKDLFGNLMFYMCQTLCAIFTQHAGSDGLCARHYGGYTLDRASRRYEY